MIQRFCNFSPWIKWYVIYTQNLIYNIILSTCIVNIMKTLCKWLQECLKIWFLKSKPQSSKNPTTS